MTISYRLASSERPTTSQTVPKLTTPTTSTTLIIRANISRRGRNGFTADSVRRGLNTSIRFEVVMYRLRCTGLINAVCGTWVMRATLALSGASCHYWQNIISFAIVQSRELLEEWRFIITALIHAFGGTLQA